MSEQQIKHIEKNDDMEFFKSYRNNSISTFLDFTAVDKDLNLRHYVEVEPGIYDLIQMNKDGTIEYHERTDGFDVSEFHEDYHIDRAYNRVGDNRDYVVYKLKGSSILFKQTSGTRTDFYQTSTLIHGYVSGENLHNKYNYPFVNSDLMSSIRQQLDDLNEHTALTKDMLNIANIRCNTLSKINKHTDAIWKKRNENNNIPF